MICDWCGSFSSVRFNYGAGCDLCDDCDDIYVFECGSEEDEDFYEDDY